MHIRKLVFAGLLLLAAMSFGVAPAMAQTGYGDDTVPPRSLTVGGTADTASNDTGGGGSNTGTIVAIVLGGAALLGAGLYGFLKKPGSS